MKEAKEEAQAEIEIFRKEQEKEFQDYQKDVSLSAWKHCKIMLKYLHNFYMTVQYLTK